MSFALPVLQHPAIEVLGWALLHFAWQGFAVALLLALLLIPLRRASAHVRYSFLCGALAVMAACPIITWGWLVTNQSEPIAATQVLPPSNHVVATNSVPDLHAQPEGVRPSASVHQSAFTANTPAPAFPTDNGGQEAPATVLAASRSWTTWSQPLFAILLPWLVSAWLMGVAFLSTRLLVGWRVIQRIKRSATIPASDVWHERCRELAGRLRIRQTVKLVESALIEVPTVIGWLRPMILLPVSALNGLEPSQLEAILAHELAHIRRRDYLVNLIQTAIETLLFYHPAVWWVSRRIREEREHCCDDIAVAVCGNTVVYARALAEMESLRASPRLTLAVNDGSLLGRIRRLLVPVPETRGSVWWAASPVVLVIMGVLLATAYLATTSIAEGEEESAVKPPPQALLPQERENPIDTLEIVNLRRGLESADQQVRDDAATQIRRIIAARQITYRDGRPVKQIRENGLLKDGDILTELVDPRIELLKTVKAGTPRRQVLDTLGLTKKVSDYQHGDEDYRLNDDLVLQLQFDNSQQLVGSNVRYDPRMVYVSPPPAFTGTWNQYYSDGSKYHSVEYRQGNYHGSFIVYYPNGIVMHGFKYVKHVQEGESVGYHPSGKLKYRGTTLHNQRIGTWTWWNEDGSIKGTEKYAAASPADTPNPPAPAKDSRTARCELTGHVMDKSGRLLKGAVIQVWESRDGAQVNLLAERKPPVRTDDDGRFEISDLPAGSMVVGATYQLSTENGPFEMPSNRIEVALAPAKRAYCRCQLVYEVPDAPEKYLSSGGPYIQGTWNEFNFDPNSMQVAGHRPPKTRTALIWGEIVHGLQVALSLKPGKKPETRTGTLVIRNTLTDRMIDFHRYRDREEFAFEVLHPDGKIEVIERDLWPLNKLRPSHSFNGIFLRPGDEYELDLGEIEHAALTRPQAGVSIRARLKAFSNNETVDAIRQEEFFPTSVLETGWAVLGQPPATAQAQPATALPLARLIVIDTKTEQPIPKFQVIPGTEDGLGNVGEPSAIIQWQPHLLREGSEGKFDWPQERTYPTFRLRIEADGYRPAHTQLIRKTDGPITLRMKLIADPGLDGRILMDDGRPAAKAQVGVAMSARTIQLEGRRIKAPETPPVKPQDQWRLPLVVETDAEGRFHLPPEISQALVVIAHESGYAELRRDQLTSKTSTITLQPWGEIAGQLLWGNKPGADEQISLVVSRPTSEWIPLVNSFGKTQTDADGRFRFENVPPGPVQLSREQAPTQPAEGNARSGLYFPIAHAQVSCEGPTSIVIGGEGVPLIGRLKGLDSWKDVTLKIFPYAPRPSDQHGWMAYLQFQNSPQGSLYHRDKLPVLADGSFRIENVPAATYQWQARRAEGQIIAGGTVTVRSAPGGKSDQPVDLGTVSVRVPKPGG